MVKSYILRVLMNRTFSIAAFCVAAVLLMVADLSARGAEFRGEFLLGSQAAGWQVTNWINSAALDLKDLRGKVVLVRWWTAPGCKYCADSAPALNEFHKEYKDRGLAVIGFYHHKTAGPLRVTDVKASADGFGFKFPVAVDRDWSTLKQWWLNKGDAQWTSVSFLLDRQGVIRHIHPGGEYVKGDADYKVLRSKIEELLAEK
jgi:peroxiredoxin